jgi:hypothetical protein
MNCKEQVIDHVTSGIDLAKPMLARHVASGADGCGAWSKADCATLGAAASIDDAQRNCQ